MSVLSFDPSRVLGYGPCGQESARKMADTLGAHSLSVIYNPDNKKFTVLNSSNMAKEAIEKIFSRAIYEYWQPQVLDETDENGNRLARLIPLLKERSVQFQAIDSRDDVAKEVVFNMTKRLGGVSFSGKTCLDVGCRSGENTVAMTQAGATVIGIDPDGSEFETAKIKGMLGERLVKATLQQYHTAFPDQQFDIATLLLWNIPLPEREEVVFTLGRVIKPEGIVIISYIDKAYNDSYFSLPILARSFFEKVEEFSFSGVNSNMLKCSLPKINSKDRVCTIS